MSKIVVLHGPNMNLLGLRETHLYGDTSLEAINQQLVSFSTKHQVECFQSNAEHELIERVHQAWMDKVRGFIINPASLTHTSIGLRDALSATELPLVEVHVTNIYQREVFRQQSYFSDIACGVITGFGAQGYQYALQHLIDLIESE